MDFEFIFLTGGVELEVLFCKMLGPGHWPWKLGVCKNQGGVVVVLPFGGIDGGDIAGGVIKCGEDLLKSNAQGDQHADGGDKVMYSAIMVNEAIEAWRSRQCGP
jgi:hypothetical protein